MLRWQEVSRADEDDTVSIRLWSWSLSGRQHEQKVLCPGEQGEEADAGG